MASILLGWNMYVSFWHCAKAGCWWIILPIKVSAFSLQWCLLALQMEVLFVWARVFVCSLLWLHKISVLHLEEN